MEKSPPPSNPSLSLILYGIPARSSALEVKNLFRNYRPPVQCSMLRPLGMKTNASALVQANNSEQHARILSKKFRLHGR